MKSLLAGLDPLLHGQVRLAIVSALSSGGPRTFTDLKELVGTTDGNLSAHARRLEQAGYVSCRKSFVGRVPKTEYRVTAAGRKALRRYLRELEGLIETARRRPGRVRN